MKIYHLEGSVDTPFSVTASDLAARLRADLAEQGITGPFVAPPVLAHGVDACEFFGQIRVVRQWHCDARLVTKGHLEIMASVLVENRRLNNLLHLSREMPHTSGHNMR